MSQPKTPWNPSRRATARVLNPLPPPATCLYCGSPVGISGNEAVYGKPYGRWPWIYLCAGGSCHSYVGMHPFTNIPLGTLADAKTREARKITKELFNRLWGRGEGRMSRAEAYEWLCAQLDMPPGECHFGWFDVQTCRRAYKVLNLHIDSVEAQPVSLTAVSTGSRLA